MTLLSVICRNDLSATRKERSPEPDDRAGAIAGEGTIAAGEDTAAGAAFAAGTDARRNVPGDGRATARCRAAPSHACCLGDGRGCAWYG